MTPLKACACGTATSYKPTLGHVCQTCSRMEAMGHTYQSDWEAMQQAALRLTSIVNRQYLRPFELARAMDAPVMFSDSMRQNVVRHV